MHFQILSRFAIRTFITCLAIRHDSANLAPRDSRFDQLWKGGREGQGEERETSPHLQCGPAQGKGQHCHWHLTVAALWSPRAERLNGAAPPRRCECRRETGVAPSDTFRGPLHTVPDGTKHRASSMLCSVHARAGLNAGTTKDDLLGRFGAARRPGE